MTVVVIRRMADRDARSFLEIHHAAVRGTAAHDYSPNVIAAWAPLPITLDSIQDVLTNPDNELRFIAEVEGKPVGIGVLVAANAELRACYVLPQASRKGVGSALVRAIESAARDEGLSQLTLDSSTTAEPFYAACGYRVVARAEHVLRSGQRMACVKMRKHLALPMHEKDKDVPTPIDFHDPRQAAEWEASTIRNRPSRPQFFAKFVEALNTSFARPFAVLELGSGPGHLAEQILRQCNIARYAALDFSAAMHARARARLAPLRKDVEYVCRDFRGNWGGDLGLFDAVVTMQAVHEVRHRRHLPALLDKTRHRLHPGGTFLFCDHFQEEGTDKNPALYFSRPEQPTALETAGYVNVRELLVAGGMALYQAINPG